MANKDTVEQHMERVYQATSKSEIDRAYDEWANTYDEQIDDIGWCIPPLASVMLTRQLPSPAGPILDAGAGTGIMGELLAPLGYTSLAALDPSSGMLAVARRRQVYTHFHEMYLGPDLDLPDAHFAAVVAVGVFTPGHAGPDGFEELIRVTQPGGPIIFSVRVDNNAGTDYVSRQDGLAALDRWREVERSEPIVSFPKKHPEYRHQLFVYKRT